ncbi:MAG: 1-deoxy-D-xylulose-5-phosphate reductoisomerase, partial [Bacteroidales bacterium]|nr:1-deoxy-D-xylulose-5-phosphate reductoisomerase [Candidatus Egerieousia equi]
RFPALRLAYSAQEKGGSMPCTMNGANEIAVAAFLRGEIKFGAIPHIIEDTMAVAHVIGQPSLEDIFQADESARRTASEALKKYILK